MRRLPLALRQGMLLHAYFVLSRRILDNLCVGRDRMKGPSMLSRFLKKLT